MSRSLYPSPKSVAAQPVTGEAEELCDGLPHLSLLDSFHKKLGIGGDHTSKLSLSEFITKLPHTIKNSHSVHQEQLADIFNRGTIGDDISALFRQLDLRKEDWEPYAFFEPSKLYTRNLVATDDETYTLILIIDVLECGKVESHP